MAAFASPTIVSKAPALQWTAVPLTRSSNSAPRQAEHLGDRDRDAQAAAAPLCVAGVAVGTAVVASSRREQRRRQRAMRRRCVAAAAAAQKQEAEPASRRNALLSPAVAAAGGVLAQPPQAARAAASGSPLALPNFGVGAWAWGDRLFWGYDEKQDADIREAFEYLVGQGVKLLDTAELYGLGRSEELVGKFKKDMKADDLLVATKYGPLPWKAGRKDVVSSCKDSLKRLGTNSIDLYQIHFPFAWSNEAMWDGLADCYEQGLVKAVGVSNYGSSATRAIHKRLAERGIPLTSNQIQYSLLYRYPELNGMQETCDELGVKILAYSPIGLGALTGKWTAQSMPSGPREAIAKELLQDPAFGELLSLMRTIAAKRGEEGTTSQVAIAWCMAKGTIPIPGVRNLRQAKDNVRAISLNLTPQEVSDLDAAASRVTRAVKPDVNPMPKESIDTHQQFFEA
eukprot:TRINITY_DN112811_c0_g1_i1.p1 TRINITY_DN112811_c0_g1~~TRINITY_DN112811_c0_g1_i1.p1  ORF type:complete len:455 (-),score=114.11 TRINITY_DN112811_c0_g1_i1:51-1415(-)